MATKSTIRSFRKNGCAHNADCHRITPSIAYSIVFCGHTDSLPDVSRYHFALFVFLSIRRHSAFASSQSSTSVICRRHGRRGIVFGCICLFVCLFVCLFIILRANVYSDRQETFRIDEQWLWDHAINPLDF